jgi:hypothetical protein
VKAVQHLLWKVDGSHVGHSLNVCVDVVDQFPAAAAELGR